MTFLDFCRDYGILIDAEPPVGIWKRFKTDDKPRHRNGAVKFMGDFGMCQNHATMTEVALWRPDRVRTAVQQRDPAVVLEQRRREASRRAESIRGARVFWNQCAPLDRPHPYIERKGLSQLGCRGLRIHDGLLVAPVTSGALISLQTITAEGEKRFWTGAPVKGGALLLTRARSALTCLVEGLATGLAIYQSVPQARVIVAFDCGNLMSVAERIRPAGSVVVCADNDKDTLARRGVNPGLEKARNVADYLGCGVAYPQGIEGTDWCDFLTEVGHGAAKRIEREVLAAVRFVMT